MIGETITCGREECQVEFTKKTHNQKYHDDECCRLATNANIMKKYYAGKERRSGKIRKCEVCETTKLSRYNPSSVCSACSSAAVMNRNESVTSSLATVVLV